MNRVIFSNLDVIDTGPINAERESEFRAMIETDYSEAAIEASNNLKALFNENIDTVKDGYFGTYITSIPSRVQRYVYVKNKKSNGEDSEDTDVCIDLLTHQYWTSEH